MAVNEAIQSGASVLASDQTSFSNLVRNSGASAVIAARDHRLIAEHITEYLRAQ